MISLLHGLNLTCISVHFATELAGGKSGKDFHFLYEEASSHPKIREVEVEKDSEGNVKLDSDGKIKLKEKVVSGGSVPIDLKGFGRGKKITKPEWSNKGDRHPACFTRNKPILFLGRFSVQGDRSNPVTITVTPTLNGTSSSLEPVKREITFDNKSIDTFRVRFQLGGKLPNEIGRHELKLEWRISGGGFMTPVEDRWEKVQVIYTEHIIYSIYGPPLKPDHAAEVYYDAGLHARASPDDGTVSGTQKRLDILVKLIGGKDRRFPLSNEGELEAEELMEICWRLHKGINNATPPYFNGKNSIPISTEPFAQGEGLPLEEQWLMWVSSSKVTATVYTELGKKINLSSYWNDASCIGHAQLAKSMLASVGILALRAWVIPHTTYKPLRGRAHESMKTRENDGFDLADEDLFWLGSPYAPHKEPEQYEKVQQWMFSIPSSLPPHDMIEVKAMPVLMEPDAKFEFFEACQWVYLPGEGDPFHPRGRFLTGGFEIWKNTKEFRKNRGYRTAAELLQWWVNIKIKGFGKRFMAWYAEEGIEIPQKDGPPRKVIIKHFFDKMGSHYTIQNYTEIRENGLELPPP